MMGLKNNQQQQQMVDTEDDYGGEGMQEEEQRRNDEIWILTKLYVWMFVCFSQFYYNNLFLNTNTFNILK